MTNYWQNRYRQALAQMEGAQSVETRAAYQNLADHYLSMRRFCEGPLTKDRILSAA